jgi:hypothetical protein
MEDGMMVTFNVRLAFYVTDTVTRCNIKLDRWLITDSVDVIRFATYSNDDDNDNDNNS